MTKAFAFSRSLAVSVCFALLVFLPCVALAQVTNLGDTTSTSVPGAGHNYIGTLNETVNPANGSVSLRINVPMPPGRKLTVPFSFAYDSNGSIVLQPTPSGLGWTSEGGWSYSIPTLSYSTVTAATSDGSGTTCTVSLNYMYSDANGGRHPLLLSIYGYAPRGNKGSSCTNAILPDGFFVDNPQDTDGGDALLLAHTNAIPVGNQYLPQQVTVADADGTVVAFPRKAPGPTLVPTSIEDRNGNVLTVNTSTGSSCVNAFSGYTDTLGRSVLSMSCEGESGSGGTDTITVDGLGAPYYAGYYGSATWTNTNLNVEEYYGSCGVAGLNLSYYPLSSLTLPDGTSYNFSYDSTWGLLNKIVYPTGAYVRYVWGVNSQSQAGTAGGTYPPPNNEAWSCSYYYDTPVITDRYVSYNGSTEVLHQHYAYSTTWGQNANWWTSKTTTVTTYDEARGGNFQTVYRYSGIGAPMQPNTNVFITNSIPLENQIQYYDWSGSLLRTVNKSWGDQYTMLCQSTTQGGQTSRIDYAYSAQGAQVTDKKEWDWGNPQTQTCGYTPSGTLLRETATNYHSFPATPIYTAGPSIFDRPSSVVVSGSGGGGAENDYTYDNGVTGVSATQHDDANYPASQTNRGNIATQTRVCSGCNNAVTSFAYDQTGQVTSMTDANLNLTSYCYGDTQPGCPGSATNAYVTRINYPNTGVAHVENFSYYLSTGELASAIDENNQTTNYYYNDPFARLTETDLPDGGKTTYGYLNGCTQPSTTTMLLIGSTNYSESTTFDGLCHVTEAAITDPESPSVPDKTDTTYDGMARVWTVSNPYRSTSDSTYGLTTYTYDALGRTTSVTYPDTSVATTSYTGSCSSGAPTTVTDAAFKTRTLCSDGLGHLTSVIENPGGSPSYTTAYTYNALDDLLSVNQGGQSRAFNYNSLSRLTSASNPESNVNGTQCTTNYSYDGNGNVISKVAPFENQNASCTNTVTTTYGYDALNRLLNKSYSDPSTVGATYAYDGVGWTGWNDTFSNAVGHLTASWSKQNNGTVVAANEFYGFDPMGRLLAGRLCTPATCGASSYPIYATYDKAGNELSFWDSSLARYPTYDAANRLSTVTAGFNVPAGTPGPGSQALINITAHSAFGGLNNATLGNGLAESRSYTKRLWLGSVAVGSVYSLSVGYAGNGDVLTANDSENGNWSYGYDPINRLQTATASGQSFTYNPDQYGNMTCTNTGSLACTPLGLSFNPNTTTNQITTSGYSYDAAGNLLSDNTHGYVYDAENRITCVKGTDGTCTSASATLYSYDPQGQRVGKQQGSTREEYVYDSQGHIISVHDGSTNLLRSELHSPDGRHLATLEGNNWQTGSLYFHHADWLGTERVRTNSSGNGVEWCTDTPYGMNLACTQGDVSPMHFTGKQRDTESGLDNFGARYFGGGNSLGRFMSPDPPLIDQHIADPQSWNLYSYVRNNPLSYLDPTGHTIELLGDEDQRKKELEFLKKQLGNDKAGSDLYIDEKKEGDKTRYFVGIKGDVGDFMKLSDTAHDLANLVENKNVVEFGLTSKDLSGSGGAATYEKGEVGNQNVRVLVNPSQVDVANRTLSPNTILGASRFAGQNQDPRWGINPFTPGVMTWHEFGHAWGEINGRPGDRTNPEAIAWENRMREQLYGPLGPNNAPRVAH